MILCVSIFTNNMGVGQTEVECLVESHMYFDCSLLDNSALNFYIEGFLSLCGVSVLRLSWDCVLSVSD